MSHATRPSFFVEIFALFSCFFAFFFATKGKSPNTETSISNVQTGDRTASTLPPPAPIEPPKQPPSNEAGRERGPRETPSAPPVGLFASHYEVVRRWIRRLGAHDECDDLAQEVIAQAWEGWPRFEPRADDSQTVAFRRWLWGITMHHVMGHHRARKRWVSGIDLDAIPSPEANAENTLILAELETLRAATTPQRWGCFVEHEVDGLKLKVIAANRGVSIGTVATWIRAAKLDLRGALIRIEASDENAARRAAFFSGRRMKSTFRKG
ncbi:MAG: sigma-70 family RNA polymerase sigma factor [Polyangiaceae bacterium]|nr:sigma-70 family RNA polymerase sigma factor [Polyangiaceae bacterium]